jgi:hypothetical protein
MVHFTFSEFPESRMSHPTCIDIAGVVPRCTLRRMHTTSDIPESRMRHPTWMQHFTFNDITESRMSHPTFN